jgi:SAM-dependent methyltransferase
MTVTIVITAYNHARFLDQAIDSVLAQTRPVDEVIVVDDGSDDDPAAVVGRYPGVRLIRQRNQGLAAARNTGLHAATGTYIGFLDADDRLRPTMVEVTLHALEGDPDVAFVYGAYAFVDEAGRQTSEVALRAPGADPYAGFLSSNLVGMHGTVLYRREFVLDEGGFDPTLPAVEDYDLYLRLARKHRIAARNEILADYRRHGSNMSNNLSFMLGTVLAVHGRHRTAASGRPDWLDAFRRGQERWRGYYAVKQVDQLARARTGSAVTKEIGRTLRVARLAPKATGRALLGRVKRKLLPKRRRIDLGGLRRTTPVSQVFGYDRGKPVDRHYIEAFLEANRADVGGRVLEIGDGAYTRRFGGDRVERSDVLNRFEGHPETTFVGDLCDGADLPSDAFDCIVLTQTLHLLFDMPRAVETLWRVLKPGGVLLVTVPWVSSIDRGEWGGDWYWSISPKALKRLLSGPFPPGSTDVQCYGNVLSATAFLYGLAEHELSRAELDVRDPYCPVLVAARAVKPLEQP